MPCAEEARNPGIASLCFFFVMCRDARVGRSRLWAGALLDRRTYFTRAASLVEGVVHPVSLVKVVPVSRERAPRAFSSCSVVSLRVRRSGWRKPPSGETVLVDPETACTCSCWRFVGLLGALSGSRAGSLGTICFQFLLANNRNARKQ